MYQLKTEDDVVRAALNILEQRLEYGPIMGNPETVRSYLKLEVMGLEHEVFGCLWLNNRHGVIQAQPAVQGDDRCRSGLSAGSGQGGAPGQCRRRDLLSQPSLRGSRTQ